MNTSESIAKIAPALVKASSAIEGAVKGRENSHFKNKYATLESVIEASRDALAENELCVLQAPGQMNANLLTVTTRLMHSSGEWIETEYQIPLVKSDPQTSGSAITYARRYALMALLNIPAVDDDGEGAMNRNKAANDRITEAQATELGKLVDESGVKLGVVLAAAGGVKALADVPACEFSGLKTKLENTIRDRKAAQQKAA